MKIAIDLDKNYELNPSLFEHIALRFQGAGHQVGIMTARHESEGCIVDFKPDFIFFLDCGEENYATRASLKSEKMKEENIDIIFDDREQYFPKEIVALKLV